MLPPEPGLTADPSGLPPHGGGLIRPRGPALATGPIMLVGHMLTVQARS